MNDFKRFTDKQHHPGAGSKEAVLSDIQRVAEELGRPPSSIEYNELGEYTTGATNYYIGGWHEAIEAAGYDVEEIPKRGRGGRINDDKLLADLRAGAEYLGYPPRQKDVRAFGEYSPQTYVKRFGSWKDALREAGVLDESD